MAQIHYEMTKQFDTVNRQMSWRNFTSIQSHLQLINSHFRTLLTLPQHGTNALRRRRSQTVFMAVGMGICFRAFFLVTRAQSSGREHPRDTTSGHPCVNVSGGELQPVCSFPGNGQWLLLTSASTMCWSGSWPCKGSPCPPSEPCAVSLTPCAAGCRGAPLYELLLFFGSAIIIINTLEMCKLHVYNQHKGR